MSFHSGVTTSSEGEISVEAAAPAPTGHFPLSPVSSSAPEVPLQAPEPSQIRHCRYFLQTSSLLSVAVGSLVLCGWTLHIFILTSVLPGLATMKPNTALCFLWAGAGLWLLANASGSSRRANWALAVSGLAAAVGTLTAVEYWPGVNFGIDELVLRRTLLATGIAHPGRMSLATAVGFATLGGSLLLAQAKPRWDTLRQALALSVLMDGLIAVVGYVYGVDALYQISPYSSMALHTAVLTAMLGLSSLLLRPRAGIMGIVNSEFLGGLIARRVLPLVILLPPILGWIRWRGELAGLYAAPFGIALFTMSEVVLLSALLLISANLTSHSDEKRRSAEQADLRLAALVESSLDAIIGKDLNGMVISWNRGAEQLFGYPAEEMLGQSITRLIPVERQYEGREILHRIRGGSAALSLLKRFGFARTVGPSMSP